MRTIRHSVRTAAVIAHVSALAMLATGTISFAADPAPLETGQPAPNFSFTDINDQPGQLSDFRGSVVLLDFWGSWCGPCRTDTPALAKLYETYRGRGFEILAVHRGSDRATVQEYVSKHGLSWPQVLEDPDGPILSRYDVRTFPTYYVIDREGNLITDKVRMWKLRPLLMELLPESDEQECTPPPAELTALND